MTQVNANMIDELNPPKTGIRSPFDTPIRIIAQRFGSRSKEIERFLKFAVVGVSGAVIDLGMVILLQATILPPKPDVTFDINVTIATSIAFICAVLSNFVWTRLWVYPDSRSKSVRRQLALFTTFSAIGGIARASWITFSYSFIGHALMPIALPIIHTIRPAYIPSLSAEEKIGTIAAQLVGMVVIMVWNFSINRYITYNDVT